jgi:hypothetical protein
MPVEKTQKITLVDYPEKGFNTNLDPTVQVQGETTLKVTCESPTCGKSVSWVIENAGNTAENVPDDAFRILILESFVGTKQVFCSWDCLRRVMKSYVPPFSPREKAEIDARNAALTPTMAVPARDAYDTPSGGVVTKEELMASELAYEKGVAVSQPDGFAETI